MYIYAGLMALILINIKYQNTYIKSDESAKT